MRMDKSLRRMAGFFKARVHELDFGSLNDRRRRQGRRWKLQSILNATLAGLMVGCRGLKELEDLTNFLSRPMRRVLGVSRRLPDTTARDTLCGMSFENLRGVLKRVVRMARRRKQLSVRELPFHMVAMDGKGTSLPSWDGPYAQRHEHEGLPPFGILRTVTSSLVTAPGRPCIDIAPIPSETNEVGYFQEAFEALVQSHGRLFELVSYDAGANSEENARFVRDHDKHYLFRLNDERRHLQQLAKDLLQHQPVVAEATDVLSNHKEVIRRLRVFRVNDSCLPPLPRKSCIWDHARVLLSIETLAAQEGNVTSRETRYFISSLPLKRMTAQQWLRATVLHWGVETCHQLLDTALAEDDRPWVRSDPNGMLVMFALRRIAYTLLTLYRSVTQRSEERRHMPWSELMRWAYVTLVASDTKTIADLRDRDLAALR